MLHPSTQQLIRKLCELTDAGHIAWKEGERQCSLFETEGYVVEIEAEPPALRLLRGDGRELERADTSDLAATAWVDGQGTYATHVAAMATKAHRIARGAEAAIARILTSLSAPPTQDAPPASAAAPPPAHAAPPLQPPKAEASRPAPPPAAPAAAALAPVATAPKPAPDPSPSAFGAVESFAQPQAPAQTAPAPRPTPAPAPTPPASPPPMLIRGFSARTVQTPEPMHNLSRALPATPKQPEPKPAPAPSIYKPWN